MKTYIICYPRAEYNKLTVVEIDYELESTLQEEKAKFAKASRLEFTDLHEAIKVCRTYCKMYGLEYESYDDEENADEYLD